MADDIRGWLADALARRPRHPALERTLFHRLEELERGPLEQLGELVRAVAEELRFTQRRLADQAHELLMLKQTVAALTGRLDALAGLAPAASPTAAPPLPEAAHGHLLLLPSADGYRLVERAGPPPALGDDVEHEGRRYQILGRKASPFPGDRRPSLLGLAI